MFCAKNRPSPEWTIDFGEMAPLIRVSSSSASVSVDGGGVVVVGGAGGIVVAVVVVVVVGGAGALVMVVVDVDTVVVETPGFGVVGIVVGEAVEVGADVGAVTAAPPEVHAARTIDTATIGAATERAVRVTNKTVGGTRGTPCPRSTRLGRIDLSGC